jgi:hypothetical protein
MPSRRFLRRTALGVAALAIVGACVATGLLWLDMT